MYDEFLYKIDVMLVFCASFLVVRIFCVMQSMNVIRFAQALYLRWKFIFHFVFWFISDISYFCEIHEQRS